MITLLGLGVTIVGNLIFMPFFSYWASVWVHLASCLVMLFVSTYLGQKHYPIPYRWREIIKYIGFGVILYLISVFIQLGIEKATGRNMDLTDTNMLILKMAINSVLMVAFLVFLQKKTHILKLIRR